MEPELQLKLVALVCLVFLTYKSGPKLLLSIKSRKWPKQTSVVTTSSIDRTGNAYEPKLIYKYAVNAREFINDTYTYLGTSTITKSQSVKIAQQNPVGSVLDIFVNPDNPEQSVVIPGVHWLQYLSLLLTVLFFTSLAFLGPILQFI